MPFLIKFLWGEAGLLQMSDLARRLIITEGCGAANNLSFSIPLISQVKKSNKQAPLLFL